MILSEMIEEVADQLRDDRISDKITRWLNLEQTRLAVKFVFPELHVNDSISTSAGDFDYPLPTGFFRFIALWIDSLERRLWPTTIQWLSANYADFTTERGSIVKYYVAGGQVCLFRVPDGTYTIDYYYQKKPTLLSGAGDESNLPEEWHDVLVQGAIVRGFKYERNEQWREALADYKEMIRELKPVVYRQLDAHHVLDGPEGFAGSKPARPKLPDNYPAM